MLPSATGFLSVACPPEPCAGCPPPHSATTTLLPHPQCLSAGCRGRPLSRCSLGLWRVVASPFRAMYLQPRDQLRVLLTQVQAPLDLSTCTWPKRMLPSSTFFLFVACQLEPCAGCPPPPQRNGDPPATPPMSERWVSQSPPVPHQQRRNSVEELTLLKTGHTEIRVIPTTMKIQQSSLGRGAWTQIILAQSACSPAVDKGFFVLGMH